MFRLHILSPMQKSYKLTTNESAYLNYDADLIKLSVIERNSLTKLQFISQKGVIWVRSIHDEYQMFRILIFGLLVKIFGHYSELNQMRLSRLKEIIYSAKLYHLVDSKGIQKQLLFKNIASNLDKIKCSSENHESEHLITGLFNTVPFFDQTIMLSIAEKFQLDYLQTTVQSIEKWFKENLALQIKWVDENPDQEASKQIYFQNKGDFIMRRSLHEKMDLLSESNDSLSQAINNNSKGSSSGRLRLLKTISVQSASPSVKKSSNREKSNEQHSERNSVSIFQENGKRSKAKNESRLWKLFCCNFD